MVSSSNPFQFLVLVSSSLFGALDGSNVLSPFFRMGRTLYNRGACVFILNGFLGMVCYWALGRSSGRFSVMVLECKKVY